ncbi:MAG: hypothetical protein M3018_13360 [Actinomycetota bacterium]|nr:hypothetical protein [Actinomycetota bacterium]
MTYLDELAAALARVGIANRQRARILAEIADHLVCDPAAELGGPDELARQFADELGTFRARRAALVAFAALAVAGVLFAIAFLAFPRGAFGRAAGSSTSLLGDFGAVIALLAPQVAFVAGLLGAVRALRRRQSSVIVRAEAVTILRRVAVGLGAGMATMLGVALMAIGLHHQVAAWWTTLALATACVGATALAAAMPAALGASRLRPAAPGPAGDLFDDLGPLVPRALRGRPWRLALTVAGTVGVAITIVGVLQADGYDGALRGVADGCACLAGFGMLGRYLRLRA